MKTKPIHHREHGVHREFRILFLLCALCALCGEIFAQAPSTVAVRDILYNADGTLASGRLEISWKAFTSADGKTIPAGKITRNIQNGAVDVSLVPNAGATPTGTSYTAVYFLANAISFTEYWTIPANGPVSISQVRTSAAPTPSTVISINQMPFGAPNQLYKTNTAGTGEEFATLSVANAGTDFNVAFGTGTITVNLPDASATARGAVTAGAQAFAGTKTFNSSILAGSSAVNLGSASNPFGALYVNNTSGTTQTIIQATASGLTQTTADALLGISVERVAWDLFSYPSGRQTDPTFSNEHALRITQTSLGGQNDIDQVAKKSFFAAAHQSTHYGAGQRFIQMNSQNCFGMGDCFISSDTINMSGGVNASGDEGTALHTIHLQQGGFLATASITTIPAQTTCNTTLTQAVSSSASAQTVTVASTTGCNVGDWVTVDRGVADGGAPPAGDNKIEAVKLTAVGAGTIAGVFVKSHLSGGTVTPATKVFLSSPYGMGQFRYLVNLTSTPYTTGTVTSIVSRTYTGSGTTWTNGMVGGDSVLPGCIALAADDFTATPFSAGSPLRSWYVINAVNSATSLSIAHRSVVGTVAYSGNGPGSGAYTVRPCARILAFDLGTGPATAISNWVILERNTFTWTAGDAVEAVFSTNSDVTGELFRVAWYQPGGSLRSVYQATNAGGQTFGSAFSATQTMTGSNTLGFTTGLDLSGAVVGTGINIGAATTGVGISLATSSTSNNKIKWTPGGGIYQDNATGDLVLARLFSDTTAPMLTFSAGGGGIPGTVTLITGNLNVQTQAGAASDPVLTFTSGSGGKSWRIRDVSSGLGGQALQLYNLTNAYTVLEVNDNSNVVINSFAGGTAANTNSSALHWYAYDSAATGRRIQARAVPSGTNIEWQLDTATLVTAFTNVLAMSSTGKLRFGVTNQITMDATALTAARTFALPDANSNPVQPSSAPANQFATGISSAGVISYAQPAFSNLSGTATKSQLPGTTVYTDQSNTYTAGMKQTLQNSASTAGLNLASSADPSTLVQGDLWINTSNLKWRGAAATLVAVDTTRNVNTSAPLGGGGSLAADLTLTCATCVTSVSGSANQITSTGGTTPVLALANPLTLPGAMTAGGNIDLGAAGRAVLTEVTNEGVTGTTVNLLAKLTGAPSTAIKPATTDTGGVIGVVVGGAGITGNAQIAISGRASCTFDGVTTAGDYVTLSATTAGQCKDIGATYPANGQQVVGRVLSTNVAAGTYDMELFGPEFLPLPDASVTARGAVTTGAQTFGGAKTFSSAPTFSMMTLGSLLFAGTGGVVSQNNANLFWDDANVTFGVGTTRSGAISTTNPRLLVVGSNNTTNGIIEARRFDGSARFYVREDGIVGIGSAISPGAPNGGFEIASVFSSGTGQGIAIGSTVTGTAGDAYGVSFSGSLSASNGSQEAAFRTRPTMTKATTGQIVYGYGYLGAVMDLTGAGGGSTYLAMARFDVPTLGTTNTALAIGGIPTTGGPYAIYGASTNTYYFTGPVQITGSSSNLDATAAASTRPVKAGTAAATPATCTANNDFYIKTDATPAGQQLFLCNSAGNGWNLVGDGGAGGGTHAILSATHTDTTAAAVVRGDLMTGQGATPTWSRLALGTSGQVIRSNATDALWATLAAADLSNGVTGSGAVVLASAPTITSLLTVNTASASTVGELIKASASQTADLFQLQDSTSSNIWRVDAVGNQEGIGYLDNGIGGIGKFQNLVTFSEQFNNAAWVATTVTVTADSTVAPDGQTTADTLAGTGASTLIQTFTTTTNGNYTFSAWCKVSSGTATLGLRIDSTGATPATGTVSTSTCTTTWQRFSVTQNFTGTPSNIKAVILPGNGVTATVIAWGAQLVQDTVSYVYARTVSATVAASAGVVSNGGAFIVSRSATDNPLVMQAAASQTGDLLQLQDSTGAVIAKIGAGGGGAIDTVVGYRVSGGATSGNVLRGNGTNFVSATLACLDVTNCLALSTAGSAGITAFNNGTASTAARSDHTHRSIHTLTWFFAGTPATGVQNMTLTLPEGITNPLITDMRVTVNTTSASASTFNIQRCTVSCTGTAPTFADIYSTTLSLAASTRTTSKAAAPNQNVTGLAAGDQFKANLVTIGASLADVTVTMTVKYENTN